MVVRRIAWLIPLVLVVVPCIVAVSCGGGQGYGDARSERLTAALAAADDSLAANSPCALAMLEAGIDSAADSLEYYDWYLRIMRYSVQRDVPDTAKLRWGQVYDYLAAQERTPRVDGMMAVLLNTKGSYYYKLHYEPSKAIRAYGEAYARLFGSDAEDRLPDVCANLGDAYVSANDMPRAAYWYRRALFLADSLKLPSEASVSLYMGLGRIYLNLGDFDSALQCYKNADSNFGLMPLNMKYYFLTNYGNYYYYAGDYAASLKVFKRMKALVEANDMRESYEMYLCLVNMADLYLNLGKPDEARRALAPAEAFFTKIGDETAIYYCHTIRMGLALKSGDTSSVGNILQTEHLTAPIDFNIVNIRQRYLRDYYVRRGDYEAAYRNLSDSIARNDSLKHNVANMRASEIMMRYSQDTLRLHYEMDMQAKDNMYKFQFILWIPQPSHQLPDTVKSGHAAVFCYFSQILSCLVVVHHNSFYCPPCFTRLIRPHCIFLFRCPIKAVTRTKSRNRRKKIFSSIHMITALTMSINPIFMCMV